MTAQNLDDVLTATATGPGRYAYVVPNGWQTGRGSFGGLVVGAMTRAVADTVGAALPIRSITAEIPAPVVPGDATIAVDVVRTGSSVTTATVRLEQAGETRALATAVCAAPRAGAAGEVRWQTQRPPVTTPWREVTPLPYIAGMAPAFARHVEYRVIGPMPLAKAAAAELLGYVGPREVPTRRDAAYVAALADAYWPAALAVFSSMRPTATIAFTLELLESPDELDPAAPVLIQASSPVAHEGYAYETRLVWGEDGRLLARNHQTFVIIK
ncbi:MAG: thioesterase family protein [Kofleriaceae bacterium]